MKSDFVFLVESVTSFKMLNFIYIYMQKGTQKE